MATNTISKEIAKGIYLHKKQMPSPQSADGTEFIYIFKVSEIILRLKCYRYKYSTLRLTSQDQKICNLRIIKVLSHIVKYSPCL